MMNFNQVPDPLDQETVFGFFHTDGKISLHAIRCMRKRHSTVVVGIIGSGVVVGVDQGKKAMSPHFNTSFRGHIDDRLCFEMSIHHTCDQKNPRAKIQHQCHALRSHNSHASHAAPHTPHSNTVKY